MRHLRTYLLSTLLLFLAAGQGAWAQTQYINQLVLIGDYEGGLIDPNVQLYQEDGWTLVDYNLNGGTDSDQIIYLLYKTGLADDPDYAPITDFYIKSTSDRNDHPDEISYGDRTYHRIAYPNVVGSESFIDSYGNLNDGAGGKYIYLYYTTDAWGCGITEISFNSTSDGAVCGNGGSTPQDLNEGAHGDNIYMHYKYAMAKDVIDVHTQNDFKPLNADCSGTIRFRLADDVANGTVATSSNLIIGNGNTAVIDLNGKALQRTIQSGAGTDAGHVFKVIDNSTLTITDSSTGGTGTISGGNADNGGAIYVDASSSLTINGSTIDNCQADYGSAIYNLGTLTINRGIIQNCTATRGWGRGTIYNNGNLTINGGTIQNNTAFYGGAIYNVYGWTTTINGGVIQNNNAIENNGYYTDDGVGGGILNYGILNIYGGTIQGNFCDREGGGIWLSIDGGIFMKGNPVIRDNINYSITSNVFVPENIAILVEANFTEGACIGVTKDTDDVFAKGFSGYTLTGSDVCSFFCDYSDYYVCLNDEHQAFVTDNISGFESVPLTLVQGTKDNVTAWWGTYYNGTFSYSLPEGAAAYTMDSAHHLYRLGTDGRTIPAGVAVVIIADRQSITLTLSDGGSTVIDHSGCNFLHGGPATPDNEGKVPVLGTEDMGFPYVLSIDGGAIGFHQYTGTDAIPAGKAYYVQ